MGTFLDPLGGAVPAVDVIIHNQGQPDGGGGGTGNSVNLIQVGGAGIALGQDPASSGPVSLPVVLPLGYSMAATGVFTGSGTFQPVPGASGGCSMYHAINPNNVTGVVVKNSAGVVYSIQVGTLTSVAGVLHLYDTATAPTAGAGTIKKALVVPAPPAGGGGGFIYQPLCGIQFLTGIAYTFTTGIADNDAGVPAAANVSINFDYA